MTTLHEYRVRQAGHEPSIPVRATVDLLARTLTYELPGGRRETLDVVTARALYMLLAEAVYTSLEPSGPYLHLERNTGDGWPGTSRAGVSMH